MIVRLSCSECLRDDWDSQIPVEAGTPKLNPTAKELRWAATRVGWRDIRRCKYSDNPLDWETHIGICPECVDDWFGVAKDDPSLFTEPTG